MQCEQCKNTATKLTKKENLTSVFCVTAKLDKSSAVAEMGDCARAKWGEN